MNAYDEQEMRVIGALVLLPERLPEVEEVLSEEDFQSAARAAWRALVTLDRSGTVIDLQSMLEELNRQGSLALFGGQEGLIAACMSVSSAAHLKHDASVVARKAALKRLGACAENLAAEAKTVPANLAEVADRFLEEAQTRIWNAARPVQQASPISTVAEITHTATERMRAARDKELSGIATGMGDLDNLLMGMEPGQLVVIGARPSVGKTALGIQMALNIARAGKRTVFVSAEQSRHQIAGRILSNLSGIPSADLRQPRWLTQPLMAQLEATKAELEAMPLWVSEPSDPTITSVRSAIRRTSADVAFVDYLQFLRAPGQQSRYEEISEISRDLKRTGREFGATMVVLAQLSREAEREAPALRHLKESGQIEQDADAVLLLWRESSDSSTLNVAVAKNREGPTGALRLHYDTRLCRIGNANFAAPAVAF